MQIKFYGTRGSLPAGLTAADVEDKIVRAIMVTQKLVSDPEDEERIRDLVRNLAFPLRGTYGGDTTCCVVRCGEIVIVLDMGSGIRRFGKEIMPEMFSKKGIKINFLMSHIHWDHIQGFPFFAPLFVPGEFLPNNKFVFYGGTCWQGTLETVLRGQMDPPVFPVEWTKVSAEGPAMDFVTIRDRFKAEFLSEVPGSSDLVRVTARRLNHPNETYGWRIEFQGKTFVFASDTEPYDGGPDPTLLELVRGADLLYLDSQFTRSQYLGSDGSPSRRGWGHGYLEWCVRVAQEANVEHLLLGHHDPASSDEQIFAMEQETHKLVTEKPCQVRAAYDGLEVNLE